MTYRTRKRLALLALVVGLPVWIVAATSLVGLLGRPPFLVELAVYVGLGLIWIVPLRRLFLGIGRGDPARGARGGEDDGRADGHREDDGPEH